MENTRKNNQSLIKLLLSLWLLGCINIIYNGQYENAYRLMHNTAQTFVYPVEAVLLTCGIFSIYFIVRLFLLALQFDQNHPISNRVICSVILLGEIFIAILGSMHASPYWGAYLINTLVLLFFHLIIIPAVLFKKSTDNKL